MNSFCREYIKDVVPQSGPHALEDTAVKISRISSYHHSVERSPFSVKLVLEGTEHYTVDQHTYTLNHHQFLVVNQEVPLQTHVQSKQAAKGICFYPTLTSISDISSRLSKGDKALLDDPWTTAQPMTFTEKAYDLNESQTGQFLSRYRMTLNRLHQERLSIDWDDFLIQLCECLVQDQLLVNGMLKTLPAQKKRTKEELFRRISYAKQYIDEQFRQSICLKEVAKKALLSKYHFVRTFKALYGMTPIQYLLQRRLSEAQQLRAKDYSYAEIAAMVGFSDPRNLRKAMVKQSGLQRAKNLF